MEKNRMSSIMILLVGLLAGCTAGTESSAPTGSPAPTPIPTVETISEATPAPIYMAEDYYVEGLPSEYTYVGETEATFEDRHFLLEDLPENKVEELVALHYYYEIAAEFERLLEQCGENESMKTSAKNTAESFEEGSYIREYLIHDLAVITQEELEVIGETTVPGIAEFYKKEAWEQAEEFQLEAFTVVKADLTWAYSEEMLARGPQLEEGRYQRGFLCGKQSTEDDWKLYEVYWFE